MQFAATNVRRCLQIFFKRAMEPFATPPSQAYLFKTCCVLFDGELLNSVLETKERLDLKTSRLFKARPVWILRVNLYNKKRDREQDINKLSTTSAKDSQSPFLFNHHFSSGSRS